MKNDDIFSKLADVIWCLGLVCCGGMYLVSRNVGLVALVCFGIIAIIVVTLESMLSIVDSIERIAIKLAEKSK